MIDPVKLATEGLQKDRLESIDFYGSCPPLVSVVMPAFNAREFIGAAIQSVLQQDYANLEVIVVDDGSTDGTSHLDCLQNERIKLLHQLNAGPAAARNTGLRHAKGELIAFLDADDLWLPHKLAVQVAYLHQHPEAGAVFGRFVRWEADQNGLFAAYQIPGGECDDPLMTCAPSGSIYTALLLDSVVHIITAMVRREVFERIGTFDEALPTGEDYEFWLRASRSFKIDQLARTLAVYRIHSASITKVPREENNEYLVLMRTVNEYGLSGADGLCVSMDTLRRRLFGISFGHAYLHFYTGSARVAQKMFAQALAHSFWHPKVWLYWVLASFKRLAG